MALWTPYAEEAPLDLSKPAVKEERNSPDFVYPNWEFIYNQQSARLPVPLAGGYPVNYEYQGYQYPPVYSASSSQMSPVSGSSTCSGHENAPARVVPVAAATSHHAPRAVPLSPPVSPMLLDDLYDIDDELSRDPAFKAYEKIALKAIAEEKGGSLLGNNPRMRRVVKRSDDDGANDSYRKQRDRNNIAAKQSRDRRKLREHKLSVRVEYLLEQVAQLDAALKARGCRRLRC